MKNEQENIIITPELVSKFVSGKTSTEECLAVLAAIRENPEVRKIVTTSLKINNMMNEVEHQFYSPSDVQPPIKKLVRKSNVIRNKSKKR